MKKNTGDSRATELAAAPARLANRAERYAAGKALRNRVPREQHGDWSAPSGRPSPVDLVITSSKGRIRELVPIRYGRMAESPFTFYRGTASNMAADLAGTPNTGIRTQVCGDCHLLNFGAFATPERRVIFDINDFDETLPGPWEWDVKRLAASFVLAARSNGFSATDQRDAATACVRSHREWIAKYADQRALDVWYARVDVETFLTSLSDSETIARARKRIAKAGTRTVAEHDFPKMVEESKDRFVIKDHPPLIYHDPSVDEENVHETLAAYRKSLPDERGVLLDRYRLVDVALKVVGVGSVGAYCAVMLMMAEDDDPLFLQIKESRASVLEPYVGRSAYANHGKRVVEGLRLMQPASDIFLGWTQGERGKHFYLRQLHDMKLKPLVEYSIRLRWSNMPKRAVGRSHAHMHVRATLRRLPAISARATSSTAPSRAFREATPTRPSATTLPFWTPSAKVASKRRWSVRAL